MTIQEKINFYQNLLTETRRKTLDSAHVQALYDAGVSREIELEQIISDLQTEQASEHLTIEQLESELDKTRKLWIQGVPGVFRSQVIKLECQLSLLKSQQIDSPNAGELAQSSPDSISVQQKEISPAALPGAATYSQTDFFSDVLGIADFVGKVKAAVKAKFSRRVDDSPPVQLTIFDVLRDWAKAELDKIRDSYWEKLRFFYDRNDDKGRRAFNVFHEKRCQEFIAMWGLV